MSSADDLLDLAGVPDRALLADILDLIRWADAHKPRSLQQEIGPSEVGTECQRQLAYGLTKTYKPNTRFDPLAAIIGTAVHKWLEDASRVANERLGRVRWVPEQIVTVADGLTGTCDLYDRDTRTVLDWKVPGQSRFAHYKAHGPGTKYRVQAHCYGQGYVNLGLPVAYVGIVFLPRAGTLTHTHLWREPFNPALVAETVARLDNTRRLIVDLDVANHPGRFTAIPKTPTDDCRLCSWWSPTPQGPRQCSGNTDPTIGTQGDTPS